MGVKNCGRTSRAASRVSALKLRAKVCHCFSRARAARFRVRRRSRRTILANAARDTLHTHARACAATSFTMPDVWVAVLGDGGSALLDAFAASLTADACSLTPPPLRPPVGLAYRYTRGLPATHHFLEVVGDAAEDLLPVVLTPARAAAAKPHRRAPATTWQ